MSCPGDEVESTGYRASAMRLSWMFSGFAEPMFSKIIERLKFFALSTQWDYILDDMGECISRGRHLSCILQEKLIRFVLRASA